MLIFILHLGWIWGTPTNFFTPSFSSMYLFACGVSVFVMWTTTFACHVESLLTTTKVGCNSLA